MPLYRSPEEKASETVTVRLTMRERRMLEHLAELEGMTLTDFIRYLIFKRADELSISEPPPKAPKRRPGRPKSKKPAVPRPSQPPMIEVAIPIPAVIPPPGTLAPPRPTPLSLSSNNDEEEVVILDAVLEEALPEESLIEDDDEMIPVEVVTEIDFDEPEPEDEPERMTVQEVIERFKETFVYRADGTKRELNDAMEFFFSSKNGPPIISPMLSAESLTSERLQGVRRAVKDSELRLAKKNLHLTYLRMMLHFAVKEPDIRLRVNPSRDLEPLTITESKDNWRFFAGPSK